MRKFHVLLIAAIGLGLGGAAFAQSQFRQRIRYAELHGQVWLNDDGGVVTEVTCISDTMQPLTDGGSWPLKFRTANADGGMPNPTINTCVRMIEQQNTLDGGLQ